MRVLDKLLEDDDLLETAYEAQGKRHPHSRTHGRGQTPAEVALRILILKHVSSRIASTERPTYYRKIGQNEAECCQLCCQLAPANLMAKHGGVESARTPGARVLEMPDAR
jgi:hypothetical protein